MESMPFSMNAIKLARVHVYRNSMATHTSSADQNVLRTAIVKRPGLVSITSVLIRARRVHAELTLNVAFLAIHPLALVSKVTLAIHRHPVIQFQKSVSSEYS